MNETSILEDEDYYDELSNKFVDFPSDVQEAIEEVFPSNDPLDQPDFNVVDYINSLFPTEQSLSNLDDVVAKMETRMNSLDDEIRTIVRGQTTVGQDGRAALEEAQKAIRQLFIQISDIKCKAEQSEETVREITRDIKQLDCAKRHLTSAITTLNHLHMLVDGVETLRSLTTKRQYGEIVLPLQAMTEVIKHFNNYTDITKIKQLSDQVKDIQTSLAMQITSDFHDAFAGPNSKNFVPNRQLAEACLVVSILDSRVKKDLLKWFVEIQMKEYTLLFHENEDVAWLDKLDRRYAWFKKHLLLCEDKFGSMFPPEWNVSERITVEFCRITKNQLSSIMLKRKNEIDVKLLLYAIQRTVNLENLLAKRFSGVTITESDSVSTNGDVPVRKMNLDQLEDSADQDDSKKDDSKVKIISPFTGIISECFQTYLYIYIESLDRNLFDLMERFVGDAKGDLSKELGLPGTAASVLPSCADLFVFYKKCLVQCTQLSNGAPMLALANTFQKYLREYASKVLQNNLPKNTTSTLSTSVSNITRDLSSAAGLIQNFLKEGEVTRFNRQEIAWICCILTTAEYCLETTQQLEEKLKEKIDPSLTEKIKLSQEQDIFHSVISSCIQLLVQDLELACEPALTAMCKIQWSHVETVGDQSPYVSAITAHLKSSVPLIRDNLNASRKYFTQFCIKFANSFIPKFMQCVYKCKPLSSAGAEQLLLDTHMLKTVLLDLPSLGSTVNRKAPASYTKVVVKGMSRAEMILKVVMTKTEPPKSFIDQFLKLLPDSDVQEFQKILEMKGLKTAERNILISEFKPRSPNPVGQAIMSPKHDTSNIRKLNSIIKKF